MIIPQHTVMKKIVSAFSGLCMIAVLHADPLSIYKNGGFVDTPVVDATNVLNTGTIFIDTAVQPWDTQNTRAFTNSGLITGSVGVRLQSLIGSSSTGFKRSPLQAFVNTGSIDILDGGGLVSAASGGAVSFNFFNDDRSYLLVNSTNIRSSGTLAVGAGGLISLTGNQIDLSGSSVLVNPVAGLEGTNSFFGFFLSSSNFIPSSGLHDAFWSIGSTTNFFPGNIVGGGAVPTFRSPLVEVTNSLYSCFELVASTNGPVYTYLSSPNSTQVVYQVIAVTTADSGIKTSARFSDSFYANAQATDFKQLYLELSSKATNLATRAVYTNSIYVVDQLAALTNLTLVNNFRENTVRPANYIVTRSRPFDFDFAATSNTVFNPAYFSSPSYANIVVTNIFAAYAAQIESTASRLPRLSDVGQTNASGRVEINAGNLNLERTRIRGEGLVSIKTTNLISSSKALIDAAHVSMNLGSLSGNLELSNLTLPSVQRVEGPIICYSSAWTNIIVPTLTDPTDTNSPNIEVKLQLLIVDASNLRSVLPVQVHELVLGDSRPNTSVTVSDRLNVEDNFHMSAERLDIKGGLVLGSLLDWSVATAPYLKSLTNAGLFQIGNQANFGEDRPNFPYQNWVNHGRVYAYSHSIDTEYFENTGFIGSTQNSTIFFTNFCLGTTFRFTNSFSTLGTISINARKQALSNGGSLSTLGQIQFNGPIWKFNNSTLSSGLGLVFDIQGTGGVHGILTDPGETGFPNFFYTTNGFELRSAGTTGDLLNTIISSTAESDRSISHLWAGNDLGSLSLGYDNNVAVGKLSLNGDINSQIHFDGLQDGSHYALYIDSLEVNGAALDTPEGMLENLFIGENITLYVAELVCPTNPDITAEMLFEDDGTEGKIYGAGKMVWVRNFAGLFGGTDALVSANLAPIRVNRTLRNSLRIDTDADGIPNGLQQFPFKPITIGGLSLNPDNNQFEVTFYGAGGMTYDLQFKRDIASNDWVTVDRKTVPGQGRKPVVLTDPTTTADQIRMYRIVYAP